MTRWYDVELERKRQRAVLEHAADKILKRDRERQRDAEAAAVRKSSVKMPIPQVPSRWVKLGDLKSALRARNGGAR